MTVDVLNEPNGFRSVEEVRAALAEAYPRLPGRAGNAVRAAYHLLVALPNVNSNGLEAEGNRQDENMSDLQTANQRLTEAARLDEFSYQGVWEDVTAVLAALPSLTAACGQASYCLRTLLPDDPDAKFTVEVLTRALSSSSPSLALQPVEPPTFHLRQYGDVSKAKLDYYAEHRTLDGFAAPPSAAVPAQPSGQMPRAPGSEAARLASEAAAALAENPGNRFAADVYRHASAVQIQEQDVGKTKDKPHGPVSARLMNNFYGAAHGAQPADRAEPAPLTDAQIMEVVRYSTAGSAAVPPAEWVAFARAILAAGKP